MGSSGISRNNVLSLLPEGPEVWAHVQCELLHAPLPRLGNYPKLHVSLVYINLKRAILVWNVC